MAPFKASACYSSSPAVDSSEIEGTLKETRAATTLCAPASNKLPDALAQERSDDIEWKL